MLDQTFSLIRSIVGFAHAIFTPAHNNIDYKSILHLILVQQSLQPHLQKEACTIALIDRTCCQEIEKYRDAQRKALYRQYGDATTQGLTIDESINIKSDDNEQYTICTWSVTFDRSGNRFSCLDMHGQVCTFTYPTLHLAKKSVLIDESFPKSLYNDVSVDILSGNSLTWNCYATLFTFKYKSINNLERVHAACIFPNTVKRYPVIDASSGLSTFIITGETKNNRLIIYKQHTVTYSSMSGDVKLTEKIPMIIIQ